MKVTLWKCRNCGAVIHGEATSTFPDVEIRARINGATKASRIGMHACSPGTVGVTDLVAATEAGEQ